MRLTPRPAQDAAIQRMKAEPTKSIALADDMGFGKTIQSVETALQLGLKRILITGIRDTWSQFAECLEAQSEGALSIRRIDSTKAGEQALADMLAGADGWFFSGAQLLVGRDWEHRKQFNADGSPIFTIDKKTGEFTEKQASDRVHLKTYKKMKPLDMLIVDELHTFGNRKSVGLRTLRTIPAEWKLGMSGTIAGNKFENMWAISSWLWPEHTDTSFTRWQAEWCSTETVYLAGGRTTAKVTGERTPGLWVSQLPCYIRRETELVAPEPRIVTVDLTPRQREQYDDLERDLLLWLDTQSGERDVLIAEIPIVLRSRLRTATLGEMAFEADGSIGFDINTQSSKLFALRGVLDEWGDQPALIYTDSKKFAKVVVARMRAAGYDAAEWSGDVSTKDRDALKAQFMAGGVKYLVCVIPAVATGIDGLQKVCSKIVWLSESENQILNAQATARILRPGMTEQYGQMEVVSIQARDTYDQQIFGRLVMARVRMLDTIRHEFESIAA